jgi:hypothetical protein
MSENNKEKDSKINKNKVGETEERGRKSGELSRLRLKWKYGKMKMEWNTIKKREIILFHGHVNILTVADLRWRKVLSR